MTIKMIWRAALAALVVCAINVATTQTSYAASTSCLPASLKSKLSQIRSKFGPIRIASAHRPGARISGTGKRSYHASCRAVDFYPPRGKYKQVVAWLKANHSGGVGTYSCGMHHIHIDNGPRVRFHKCSNSRGARISKKRRRNYASYKGKKRRYASKRNRRSGKRYTSRRSKKYYAKRTYRSRTRRVTRRKPWSHKVGRWQMSSYAR